MSLRVSFDLDEDDLLHFRLIVREARRAVARKAPEDIVAGAQDLLQNINTASTPGFIRERIGKLTVLIRMLTDVEWRLPHEDSSRVLGALAYFTDPEDLIPDQIPGLGFLDDAIMVELVVRELRYEIDAYQEFCELRESNSGKSTGARDSWLEKRREDLQLRMRQQRERGLAQNDAAANLRLLD